MGPGSRCCAALWIKSCQTPDRPKIDPKTQVLIDFTRHADSVITLVVHDSINAEANRTLARAQTLADSLSMEAVTHADSALGV